MDHRWRADPGPLQGNICPRCSTPHFPFCLPNLNPIFPVVHNLPSTDQLHVRNHPALSPHSTLHLSHGPHFSEGSPNFNLAHNNQFQPSSAILDRGSKRLKMDGTHLDSYPTEVNDERRLKLIHEHGGGMNGISPNAQYYNQTSHETLAAHTNYQAGCLHSDLYGCANTPHYDRRINTPAQNYPLGGYAQPYTIRRPDQTIYRCGPVSLSNDSRLLTESRTPTMEGYPVPASYPRHYASSNYANPTNEDTNVQLPLTPPPLRAPLPPPYDMPQQWITQPKYSTGSARSTFLFPVDVRSSTSAPSLYPPVPEVHSTYQHIPHPLHSSGGFFVKDSQGPQTEMYQLSGQAQHVVLKHNVSDKPKMVDVFSLFKPPNRDRRPDHFVIILRGLPGSGKSYFARMIRNLELENGGKAPRIHSMDDYFMTEVDKVEENETSKSSVRGRKPVVKKVLEYCYEAEMEEAYRSSMLKAFKKTLDEGFFTIVIVDDRNLRVADFAQFWATAKRSGYEVYLLETSYNDPVGCKARNIHGFTRHDIEKMAGLWEEAPSLYLQLDAKSLLQRDDLKESNIKEVDMDMDDEELYRGSSGLEERKQGDVTAKTAEEVVYDGSANKKILDAEADHPDEEIKGLKCSKWSGELDEDNVEVADKMKHKSTSISGMFHAYGKEGKSVCWGDQIPNTGFSIGAMKKENAASLIIGPGSGYNLKSNPLAVEEAAVRNGDVKKKRSIIVFQEHLRAERESFKAVFDQRRQRIGRQ